jgi:hypothetical protein
MIAWLRALSAKMTLRVARLQDPNRKEGFWESVFRWWP